MTSLLLISEQEKQATAQRWCVSKFKVNVGKHVYAKFI